MLVPAMSLTEILVELTIDFSTIRQRIRTQGLLLQKEMIRKGLKKQAVTTSLKSPRYNQWNIVHVMDLQGVKTFFYVKVPDGENIAVYSFIFEEHHEQKTTCLIKYYKHFFDRYNERMSLGFNEISKTINYFFKKNSDFALGNTGELENGISSCHFIYEEGMGISWKNENESVYHMKTFVSKEMYTNNQQQLAHHLQHEDGQEFQHIVKLEHLRKVW